MKEYVYRGDLYGGGISYGYHWAMGDRWGMEVTVGGGYAQLSYDKYLCRDCGERVGRLNVLISVLPAPEFHSSISYVKKQLHSHDECDIYLPREVQCLALLLFFSTLHVWGQEAV